MRQGARVDAGGRDGDAVGVGPRDVEGGDSAGPAELVLGRVGAEGVCGEELVGAGLERELGRGHDEVAVPPHGAVGAVADPGHHARRRLHLPPHAPAVAPAAVDDLLRAHRACGSGKGKGDLTRLVEKTKRGNLSLAWLCS